MAEPVIEEIKQKIDIVDLIGHYITLRQNGVNFKGVCPFHSEKTPSFMVNRERQIFRCFGCGEAGDIFSFIMKQENLDFANALRLLADRASVTLPERSGRKAVSPDLEKPNLQAINALAAKFFHQVLVTHPVAQDVRAYLAKRKVSESSIATFQLGYAPARNEALTTVLAKQNKTIAAVKAAGSPERFRNRLIFPFRDILGHVIAFSARALSADQVPKYLNTSETDLFHKNRYLYGLYEAKKAIADAKKVLLVEGPLDLILSHQAGTPYCVATSGTALTEGHLALLRRYSDTLLVAFDGDSAGQKAVDRAIKLALPFGYDVSVVMVPEGKDPGDIAGESPEEWRSLVSKPVPAIDWLFQYYFPVGTKKMSPKERDSVYAALFPYISLLDDTVSQTYAVQRLALLLGLSQHKAVLEAYEKWQTTSAAASKPVSEQKKEESSLLEDEPTKEAESEQSRRERSLIGYLLLNPAFFGYKDLVIQEADIAHTGYRKLYTLMENWYNDTTTKSSPDQFIPHVLNNVPAAAKPALQKLIFDIQTTSADLSPEQVFQEYALIVQSLRQRQRDARIQSYAVRIAEAEAANDRAKVVALMQEMQHSITKETHAKKDS